MQSALLILGHGLHGESPTHAYSTVLMQVRGVYAVLLESKADRWQAQRTALIESIEDLAAFYRALQALPRSTSTADLSEWFEHLIDQVSCPLGMAP